jgi:hypothetical protein
MDWVYQVHDRDKWQAVVEHGHGPSSAVKCNDILDFYFIIILITITYYLMYNLICSCFLLASCLSYIFTLTC